MATKVVNLLDALGMETLEKELDKIAKTFTKKEFRKFIGDKCIEELKRISNEELAGVDENDISFSELIKYKMLHQMEVGSDYVLLFNDAMADLNHLNPETSSKYPDGLSIAKLIEYGMGINGTSQDDWQTQMNPNRDYSKKWAYRKHGNLYMSLGIEGKMIYEKLENSIYKNFESWVDEWFKIDTGE